MSRASDEFLARVERHVARDGFRLRSGNALVRKAGDVEHRLVVGFDGRGGLVALRDARLEFDVPGFRGALRRALPEYGYTAPNVSLVAFSDAPTLCPVELYGLHPTRLGRLSYEEKYPETSMASAVSVLTAAYDRKAAPVLAIDSALAVLQALQELDPAATEAVFSQVPLHSWARLCWLGGRLGVDTTAAKARYRQAMAEFLALNPVDFAHVEGVLTGP